MLHSFTLHWVIERKIELFLCLTSKRIDYLNKFTGFPYLITISGVSFEFSLHPDSAGGEAVFFFAIFS